MINTIRLRRFLLLTAALATTTTVRSEDLVDFNRDIRPIFNRHCIACHGGVKQAGDLSFVYADQALSVVEPGDPENSYMIERVKSDDEDERMPPPEHGRALDEEEIATLEKWVQQGAKWGEHWAFVPPQSQSLPGDAIDSWSRTRLDRFILDSLRAAGLTPAQEASPERWLRRVSLDLIGLPPTPHERQRFLNELTADGSVAYRRAVDRLLASPEFGERWASPWLDAVRYADSRGLGQDGRRTIWKYRDWVIDAWNDDMPYDQFTVAQLAGDLLPEASMADVVATAAHRLTQTNEEGGTDDEMFRTEAVIDRVNTVWQAWQGLSFGCVQCHSHPYDPIRHEEYYEFLAFFNDTADSDLTDDKPTIGVPLHSDNADQAWNLDRQIAELTTADWDHAFQLLREEYLWKPLNELAATTNNSTHVEIQSVDGVMEYQTKGTVAKETTVTLTAPVPQGMEQITAVRFTGLPEDEVNAAIYSEWGFVISHFSAELITADGVSTPLKFVRVVADEPEPILDPQLSLNPKSAQGFGAYSRIHYPRSAAFVLAQPVAVQGGAQLKVAIAQNVFELGAFPLVAHRGRVAVSDAIAFTEWWHDPHRENDRLRVEELKRQRKAIPSVNIPVMRQRPAAFSRASYVFDRGNYLTKTDRVTASVPDFLFDSDSISQEPDNRLDLARWLVSRENPLTARVAVNRIWAELFGIGLVETQEDFGASGTPPSHPRLLDDLAVRFQSEMDWSIKSLLREIVCSSTYRQSSQCGEEALAADPRNRLLSRGSRRRLAAEVIRDQALSIAGLLSHRLDGPPVYPPIPEGVWKPFQSGDKWRTPEPGDPDRYRRTIYTYTKRSIPFPEMAAFDAPSREFCSMRRLPSNTPLQALMTLNDVTFTEAAAEFATRIDRIAGSLSERLRGGFLIATSRQPSDEEIDALSQLYQNQLHHGHDRAMQAIASVLLNLDEVLSQ